MDENKLLNILKKVIDEDIVSKLKSNLVENIMKYLELIEEVKITKLSKNKKEIYLNLRKLDIKIKTELKILELI